jgi:hypothetical protein
MTEFNIETSMRRAERLLGTPRRESSRRERSDRGVSRLPEEVIAEVRRLAGGQVRPRITDLLEEVGRFCKDRGLRPVSRAALYRLLDRLDGHGYLVDKLPHDVRLTIHNLDPAARVPGGQLAFHCLNYGGLRAMSFAAGLPWLDLHQARLKRGWRSKSRGLLEALCRARGI